MELIRYLFFVVFTIASVGVNAVTANIEELEDYAMSNDTSDGFIDISTCKFFSEPAYWLEAGESCRNASKQLLCYRSEKEIDGILNSLQLLPHNDSIVQLWFHNRNCSSTEKENALFVRFEKSGDIILHTFHTEPGYNMNAYVCCSGVFGPCTIHPCKNGGTCSIEGKKSTCKCSEPFSGELCERDPCSNHSCLNGGTCSFNNEKWIPVCDCIHPYTGEFCEQDPCTSDPCKNGGTCSLKDKKPICECVEPFSGELCETDPCSNFSCKNNGTCDFRNQDNKPTCKCIEPFWGKFCEADPCAYNPCKNNGTCSVELKKAKCDCVTPYMGEFCETDYRYVVITSLLAALLSIVIIQFICWAYFMSQGIKAIKAMSQETEYCRFPNGRM